jgi:hypothetical protein
MNEPISYRGRSVSPEEVVFIRELIARHPDSSRRHLSKLLCEAWDWRQANGALRDMVCRSLMLKLHRAGMICLPAKKHTPPNPLARRQAPATDLRVDESPLEGPLKALQPLRIELVRRSGYEALFNGLIEQHHYLAYTQPVGEHLKYMMFFGDRPIACMGWSSAAWHIGCRDRFIGWSPSVRRGRLHLLAYNTRFLILPWVRVPHLASHLLGVVARRLSGDWQELYHHPIHYLETFVDQERFSGTCYRAANWLKVGETTGRGIKNKTQKVLLSRKDVYPLGRYFRRHLCGVDQ